MKQWSTVLIADLHLKSRDSYGVDTGNGGLDTRTLRRLWLLDQAVDYAVDNQVDCFTILGDLFNSRTISEAVREQVARRFLRLEGAGIKDILFVPGNHELYQGHVPLLSDSVLFPRLQVIVEPCKPWSDLPIFCVPDLGKAKVEEAINSAVDLCRDDSIKAPILFGHFAVAGAYMTDTEVNTRGVDPELLKKFPVVLLGDFHRKQLFDGSVPQGYTNDRDFLRGYVGSLARNSFSEEHQQKGFAHLAVEQSPEDDGNFRYIAKVIPVEDDPFVTIDVTDGGMDKFAGNLPDVASAIVRIRFYGTDDWFSGLPVADMVDLCYGEGAQFVKTEPTITVSGVAPVVGEETLEFDVYKTVTAAAKNKQQNLTMGLRYIGDALTKVGN